MKERLKNMRFRISKEERGFLLTQLYFFLIFSAILLMVLVQAWHNMRAAMGVFFVITFIMLRLWVVFAINNYVLVPKLFMVKEGKKRKRWLFSLLNLVLIAVVNFRLFIYFPTFGNQKWQHVAYFSYSISSVLLLVVSFVMVGLAIGRNSYKKQQQLNKQLVEEKSRNTEAELAWLKNQLNPHFLFNTLNNISSLVQIDSDMAQDKIGQLSDLLRYALYETKSEFVPLKGELEFMQNYIDLMSLRCGSNVDIKTNFDIKDMNRTVAPMLFLAPIENAFKHGVSSSKPSFIHISMTDDGDKLVFRCDNSNYPKDDHNRSGSGIGIENLKRRLQLIYPDRHSFEQSLVDNTYTVKFIILCPSLAL